jgi:nicotinamide-nucleotide amidase
MQGAQMSVAKDPVEEVARAALEQGLRVVTAESVTGGAIATRLAAGADAARWFGGGVVAYQESVKFELLGVPEGPVVSAPCAEQMARGAMGLFEADVAVSTTGVGGPGPSEGKPPGTVFLGVTTAHDRGTRELRLAGEPAEIIDQACAAALALMAEVITRGGSRTRE